MATFTTRQAQAQTARTAMSAGQAVYGHGRFTVPPGTTFAAGDTIRMFNIPAAARVLNAMVVSDKLDTGGTPAIAFNVGDQNNPTRYFSASTVGQAGGVAELAIAAPVKGFEYQTDDVLVLTVTTAAATLASGVRVDAYVEYFLS